MVTRAGPSTSSYVFAFVFPLSLLAVTIFTSLRVDDKLEREFREEVRGSKTSWLLKFCGLLLCLKLGFVWGCVDLKLVGVFWVAWLDGNWNLPCLSLEGGLLESVDV